MSNFNQNPFQSWQRDAQPTQGQSQGSKKQSTDKKEGQKTSGLKANKNSSGRIK